MKYFRATLLPVVKAVVATSAVVVAAHAAYSITPAYAELGDDAKSALRETTRGVERVAVGALLPMLLVAVHVGLTRWNPWRMERTK